MKKIVIFGCSSFARQAFVYISQDSQYEIAAFTVHKEYLKNKTFMGLDVIPFEDIQGKYPIDEFAIYVAIGYKRVNRARAEIYNLIKEPRPTIYTCH